MGTISLRAVIGAAIAGMMLLGLASAAWAAPGCEPGDDECPPLLAEIGEYGTASGQLQIPRSMAADPGSGLLFVADHQAARVSVFNANGVFVRAWGWGVLNGTAEPQVCTSGTGCMAGLPGNAAGQINGSVGIAVDGEGFVWVRERGIFSEQPERLQKFSQSGELVLMIGGGVNKTKVGEREEQEANSQPVTVTEAEENLCTAASGDKCGEGVLGTGQGEFGASSGENTVSTGPGETIYVGDKDRVQVFEKDGSFKEAIPLTGAGVTRSLTVTPGGRLYVISDGVQVGGSRVVREIGPAGQELGKLQGDWQGRKVPRNPIAVSSDAAGNVYVIGTVVYDVLDSGGIVIGTDEVQEVVAFDATGALISFEAGQAGFGAAEDSAKPLGLATNLLEVGSSEPGPVYVAHYLNGSFGEPSLAYIRAYGPQFGTADPEPPVIVSQYAVGVASTDAAVEARISPRFAASTTFQVQYGTGKCSEGGCASLAPSAPAALGGAGSGAAQATGPVTLGGLLPATVYHYRFVAQNEAGGPVGPERTIRTYPAPGTTGGCPNDSLREGAAALLPDCRAYELVSPLDKDGGEIIPLADTPGYPTELLGADPAGGRVTFSSYRAFADPAAAPYSSQYMAQRDPSAGWRTQAISPPREGVPISYLRSEYRVFSEDLGIGWLVTGTKPLLAPGAVPGYRNLYTRDSATGTYEAQCSVVPLSGSSSEFTLEPQGASADGTHTVFRANGALVVPTGAEQVYECVEGGELRLVSVLPGGAVSPTGGSVGTAANPLSDVAYRQSNVLGGVSADGSRIFWTAAANGPAALYARIAGTTSVQIASANARFRQASTDGTRVIYSVGAELLEATVGSTTSSSEQIADEVAGFMGASADAKLVYFVSREDLDGGGAAQDGKPNLYLHRADPDTDTFIATLSEDDAREVFNTEETAPVMTPVARSPYNRSSRVSGDGLNAAFASTASLTGYDNTDLVSGQADAEVYVYDAEAGELACVSCNPGGARPRGANIGDPSLPFWAAAVIPGWEDQHHAARALSEDGNRLFFEAVDALALGDTNGVQDVYQWEREGTGSCTAASSTFSPAAQGCVNPISSGKSPDPSELIAASADGDNVFFKTTSSLWRPDPGLTDVYDARVNGGFAAPPPQAAPCEGEGCRSPAPAPGYQSPSSLGFVGPGDPPKANDRRCPKGKRKVKREGKVRCVAKKKKQGGGGARKAGNSSHDRGAGR